MRKGAGGEKEKGANIAPLIHLTRCGRLTTDLTGLGHHGFQLQEVLLVAAGGIPYIGLEFSFAFDLVAREDQGVVAKCRGEQGSGILDRGGVSGRSRALVPSLEEPCRVRDSPS